MIEKTVQQNDVLVRSQGALRRLTLNRPKALNALTLGMAETMTAALRAWADDDSVGAILIDGSGDRGLCAGGDLRALYDAAKAGRSLPARFWATEYQLDVLIARYRKPVIVIMDGLVMGGGVGISAHAAHRVVTERSLIAMPEVSIGYFPDVGASYLLARSPGFAGTYLALTGARIGPADAIYAGLADVHIPAAKLPGLPALLADCRTGHEVMTCLGTVSVTPGAGTLSAARPWIDHCFGTVDVEECVNRLRGGHTEEEKAALAALMQSSPTSLKIALRNVRSALSFTHVELSFQQDYRISLACIAGREFIEGIRAAIVDKDRAPVWRPTALKDVTPNVVERHFRPIDAMELTFTE